MEGGYYALNCSLFFSFSITGLWAIAVGGGLLGFAEWGGGFVFVFVLVGGGGGGDCGRLQHPQQADHDSFRATIPL